MLFVRSDAGGVSHAPEERTGVDAVVLAVQALEARAARAGRRVIDWDALARPSLRGLVRYDPGPSRDSIRCSSGLDALEPLHWNEDRFEPPQAVLEAAAAESSTPRSTPSTLFADFRERLARWLGVPAECVTPGARRAGPDRVARQVFLGPGTPVVVPKLTYGLYAQVSAAAGAESSRASRRPASRSTSTRSPPAAVATGPPRLDLRSQQPDRHALEPAAWTAFLDAPAGRTAS